MKKSLSTLFILSLSALSLFISSCASGPNGNMGLDSNASARKIEISSRAALNRLYRQNPKALEIAKKAKGVLIFPTITKAGFIFGGSGGDGALYQRNKATGYYRTISATWGFQAGIQRHSYALFLMDDYAMAALNRSGGWDLGSNPNLVVVDRGRSETLSTTTYQKGSYIFAFDHMGLMGGIDIQGTKITRLNIR